MSATFTRFTKRSLLLGGACLALGAALTSTPALAQDATNGAAATPTPAENQTIVVTGSAIRRTNLETASPLDVFSAKDLVKSGYDTVTSVLTNITANGAGTLSANNSEAFAGGASGIALRGLSVGATLTLVDGHRLAPYPLSDDGERQFVDVQSIPFSAVDRVEILKDGASSLYGSDAIAGVVNIILKKQITGIESKFEVGTSQHGGGASRYIAVSAGQGDLAKDGYNAYITAEYRAQSKITLPQRSYQRWARLDFTDIGGNNLTPGAPNVLNGYTATPHNPYVINPDGSFVTLSNQCSVDKIKAGQCTYQSPQVLLAPTRNINVLTGLTKDFDAGWEAKVRASFFDSKGQQSTATYNAFPGPGYGGNVSNPYNGNYTPGVGVVPSFTLPAGYLGNPAIQQGAYLEGLIPGLGLPQINIDTKTYRIGADVTGSASGWDLTGALGFSYVRTHMEFDNYVNYQTLYTDLTTLDANGQPLFNPLGGNSAAELQKIAPTFYNVATDQLFYAQANASRKLFDLPGGGLSLALGVDERHTKLKNPGPAPVLAGTIGGTFSTYAFGSQNDIAGYVEADAKFLNTLDLVGSARDDYYNTYGNSFTPKVGLTWKPIPQVVLRGTFSKGFRAPTPAEIGKSATVFGLGGFQDSVLCPNGNKGPFPAGTVPAACSEQIGFVQKTNPLQPEKSTSFTGGAVFEPFSGLSTTIDYYHIKIDHQIVSASELPSYSFTDSNCLRGPDVAQTGVSTGAVDANGNPILTSAVPIAGPLAACVAGYVNAQTTVTSGLDIESQYRVKLGDTTLSARIEWTHLFNYDLTAPNGTTYKLAGTHGPSGVSGDTGNPRDRINGSIGFDHGPLSATLSGYWIKNFSVVDRSASNGAQATCEGAWNAASALAQATPGPLNAQYCKVASFASFNLVTAYRFNPKITLQVDVDNLFDANAPIDAETYGGSFTPVNPSLHEDGIIGRFFRMSLDFKY